LLDGGRVTKWELERTWSVLEEMMTLYYPPFRADSEEELLEQTMVALRRYIGVLSNYDRETLERGWARVVEAHKVERWPVIGVIDAECHTLDPQRRTTAPTHEPFVPRPKAMRRHGYKTEIGLISQEEEDLEREYDLHGSTTDWCMRKAAAVQRRMGAAGIDEHGYMRPVNSKTTQTPEAAE